jgi:hypothetical protein
MHRHLKTLLAASTMAAGLTAAPALHAHDSDGSGDSMMMGSGMMGQGMMGGMMSMLGQMSGMMEHCNQMMQAMDGHGAERPNEQWRNRQPEPGHRLQQQGRNG